MASLPDLRLLGFSYGFRPGRSQHHALDALSTAILRKKVNWVLDADIRGFLDWSSHYAPSAELLAEEARKRVRDLDSQASPASAADVNRVKLSALYSMQDGLSRNAQNTDCFEHRHVAGGCLFHEASA
jgi:hypothetical protein